MRASEKFQQIIAEDPRYTIDAIADALRARGGQGLRTSKPEASKRDARGRRAGDGLLQFIWRMARFHSGADMTMPITAYWELQRWMEERGIDAQIDGITDAEGRAILDLIEGITRQRQSSVEVQVGMVDRVLIALGYDLRQRLAAAARWGRAFGMI